MPKSCFLKLQASKSRTLSFPVLGVVSVDFTPDAKLIVTLSALIPEAYIIGRAPSQETSNYQNSTLQDALEATETSDAPQENENGLDADIYQGVAIWNWRDSGQAPHSFDCSLLCSTCCFMYRKNNLSVSLHSGEFQECAVESCGYRHPRYPSKYLLASLDKVFYTGPQSCTQRHICFSVTCFYSANA